MSSTCYNLSVMGQAFGVTQMTPWVFLLIMFLMKAITQNCIWVIYGLWLYLPQFMVFCFQRYFLYIRLDPICSIYQSFGFPSLESFYLGVGIGLFVTWSIMFDIEQSTLYWIIIYICGIIVPVILIFTEYNVWWEILFSFSFGFLSSWTFTLIAQWFLRPHMKYVVHVFPFREFGYSSIWTTEGEFEQIEGVLYKLDAITL